MRRSLPLLVSLLTLACAEEPSGPPNLLLVTIDTLRADALACYGGEPDVGREICSLAEGGTRFAWAFATASHTVPSVASLLTSRYPSQHGVSQAAASRLREQAVTFAEALRGAGYATAAFVSNPVLDRSRFFGKGFEIYDAEMTGRERNRPNVRERGAEATTDDALAWALANSWTPWLLWVHYQDPHGPYDPPAGSAARDRAGDPVLPTLRSNSGRGGIPAYQVIPGLHTRAAYHARYLDEIRQLDPHVGRLISTLDSLGSRPAVLLTADHGEAFGEDDFYFAHGHSVGLELIRVPLIYRSAAGDRSRVVETPVSLIDLGPTLLRIAGVAIPSRFQGRPLPLNGEPAEPRPAFAEHQKRVAMVSEDVWWSRARDGKGSHRSSRLPGRDGRAPLPAFSESAPDASALADSFDRFLASTRVAPAGAAHREIPAEMAEQLRALGYADETPQPDGGGN